MSKRCKYKTFSEAQYWEVTSVLDHTMWEELSDSMWAQGLGAIAERVITTEDGWYWCDVDEDTFWQIVYEELG